MTAFRCNRWAAAGALGILLAGWLLAGSAGVAQAQVTGEAPGYYVSGAGGLVFRGDDKVKGDGIDTTVSHDFGLGLLGALGMRFDNGLRAEFEVGYRREDTYKAGGVQSSGSTHAINFGPNLIYDIRTGSRWTPYLGVGVSGADVGYHISVPGNSIDSSGLGFGYQGIIGMSYALTDRLQLTLDYRYFRVLPVSLSTGAGFSTDANYHAHTILVGLRWLFYPTTQTAPPRPAPQPAYTPPAPAPMAPAAPAPAPVSYIIYFEFDSARVTSRAESTIQDAASAIKRQQATRITVTGHTDLSGSDQYNLRLSMRRANAVKAALMRLGVPADSIAVLGKDGEDPAVPTPIGVREPGNRRAEIVF